MKWSVNSDERRPPRGGRGLKYVLAVLAAQWEGRPPRGGRGLKLQCWAEAKVKYDRRPPRGGRGLKL